MFGRDQPLVDGTIEENAAWIDAQEMVHENGKVIGRIGMTMKLYFERQTDLERRKNLMELIKRFRSWIGEEKLGWWGSSMTGRMHLERKKKFDAEALWEKGRNPRLEFAIAMSSIDAGDLGDADNARTVTAISNNSQRYLLKIFADRWERDAGYVRMHFPLTWVVAQPPEKSLGMWLKSCCDWVNPIHGVMGLGIMLPDSNMILNNYTYGIQVWMGVKRFPGLEAEFPLYNADKGMSAINWMTVAHDKWLDRIGGREAVKAQCKPPVIAHDWSEGLIIQAGDEPMLGHTEAGIDLPHYRTVAHLLKPLRYTGEFENVWLRAPGPRNDDQMMRDSALYLSRFD